MLVLSPPRLPLGPAIATELFGFSHRVATVTRLLSYVGDLDLHDLFRALRQGNSRGLSLEGVLPCQSFHSFPREPSFMAAPWVDLTVYGRPRCQKTVGARGRKSFTMPGYTVHLPLGQLGFAT